jgi:hypothetical protein
MKINRIDVVSLTLLGVLAIYLFAQSPAPLADNYQNKGEQISINALFDLVAEENNKARKLWTGQIVITGKKSGLKFGEKWYKEGIEEGPLPALFLREVAKNLEKSAVPLSLFLGSDYPISAANMFKGFQAQAFEKIRATNGEAQYFYSEDVSRYTAMYADNVVVMGCATCHNEHADSPKTDWKMNDIMGATTWTYPNEFVTRDETVAILSALRMAFAKAYDTYLTKLNTFDQPPVVGTKWPTEGYFIPSLPVFLEHYEKLASPDSLALLLKKGVNKESIPP